MSLINRVLSLAVIASLLSGPTLADQLPMEGKYGNADGCAFVADENVNSDSRIIVTGQSVEFHESSCDFLQVLSGSYGRSVVTALCSGEGEDWVSTYLVLPDQADAASLVFKMQGADEFGFTVSKCN